VALGFIEAFPEPSLLSASIPAALKELRPVHVSICAAAAGSFSR